MISHLTLKNFQIHDDQEIELDPLATTFVGPSDRGKSAFLRSLKWLCLNTPRGADFVKHGENFCGVSATVDGKELSRYRGKDSNSYCLDGATFEAIGNSVPQEVQDLLQVSEDNWQSQLAAPFWLSLSPPDLARELNAVVNLTEIDQVFERVASQIRRFRAEESVVGERWSNAQKEASELAWVELAYSRYQQLEAKQEQVERLRSQVERLDALVFQAEQAQKTTEFLPKIQALLTKLARVQELASQVQKLGRLLEQYQELQTITSSLPALTNLVKKLGRIITARKKLDLYQELLYQHAQEEQQWRTRSERSHQYDQKLSQVKSCPLCGQKP